MYEVVLIPAYEPDNNLIKLVDELLLNKFEVVVVNDGSSNEYDKIFNNINTGAKVISYNENRGKGYALKTGMKYIKENYKDYIIVTMDSDGQHTIKDARKLCDYIKNHNDELVIGKRIRNNKTPLRSKIGNRITKVIYHVVTGVKIYDTQTGLRCFTNDLMDFLLNIEGDRFEYEMNVLLYAPINNIKITEIEIETIYIDNNSKSHFDTIKDSFKVYKEIIKFSFSSIISFIVDYIFYALFILLLHNIIISNVLARIISGTLNYNLNKRFVFKSNKNNILNYFLLALSILMLNTIILNILVYLGINLFIAKIITEISLFLLSFLVQKNRIFKFNKSV